MLEVSCTTLTANRDCLLAAGDTLLTESGFLLPYCGCYGTQQLWQSMTTQPQERHAKLLGTALVIASAVVFSLAGVFTKLIESDAWTIACWRGLFGAIVMTVYIQWRHGSWSLGALSGLGWRGWLLATVGSLSSLAFISAFKNTYVANVTVIYATVPFIAAAMEWGMRGQAIRPVTLVAAVASLVGVAVMVSGGVGSANLFGDGLALLMTLGMALYMVMIRTFRNTPAVLAGAASALQLFVLGWFVVDPLAVTAHDALLLVAFGVAFAVALVLLTEGAKLIPAAESGLLGSAETPLAPVFAWIILAELPPLASLVGGAIVLAAVFAHASVDFRQARA